MSKSLETLGWGRRPGGVLGIYIHVYTFWRETACQPDSAAALETTSPKTSETYLHFAAALKTTGGGYIGVQPGVDTLNSIQVKSRFVNPSRRTVKKHLTKL